MSAIEKLPHLNPLAGKLAARPDVERIRLRLGTELISHRDSLWPEGGVPSTEWIRANAFHIVAALELVLRHDGRDVRRLPRRLHWVLWLLADVGLCSGASAAL